MRATFEEFQPKQLMGRTDRVLFKSWANWAIHLKTYIHDIFMRIKKQYLACHKQVLGP